MLVDYTDVNLAGFLDDQKSIYLLHVQRSHIMAFLEAKYIFAIDIACEVTIEDSIRFAGRIKGSDNYPL